MNNSLQAKLDFIKKNNITEIEGYRAKSYFNPGLKANQLPNSFFHPGLPSDYLEFLAYADGCTLFNSDDLDGFVFFGSKDLIGQNMEVKHSYKSDWDNTIIIFCSILGEGNYIGFRISDNDEYEILDCFHEYLPAKWTVIDKSFDRFLEELIDLKGYKYWL